MTSPTIVESKELADSFVKDQEARHKEPGKFRGYRFPMPWFMDRTGGWGQGWICFIYGKAGHGKTSMLTTATTQLGRDGVPFLYISLEETLYIVTQRIFSNLQDISRTRFRDIALEETDWPNVYAAAMEMGKFNGYWTSGAYEEGEIIQAVKDTMPEVVILDYLQLMMTSGNTMVERVSNASKLMQRLAKGKITGRKHTVLCACQLNDNGQPLGSRDPDRDADLTVEVAKIENGTGGFLSSEVKLSIKKFRYGSPDSVTAAFFGARSLIGEFNGGPNRGRIPRP